MIDRLRTFAEERKTILCFGIDPVVEKLKSDSAPIKDRMLSYFCDITDKLLAENEITAIKPNYAFFAQYGFDGLYALKAIMEKYKNKVPIILDAKRGDIGKTSEAYAREAYDFWGADAVTVHPYMGEDSVKPFLREGKLVYMLCRTSNSGAKDFEELKANRKFVYEHVAQKAVEWKTGIVVGATSDSIKRIIKITKGKDIPMLVPGIGAQGGDLEAVMKNLKKCNDIPAHRINASSSLSYAYEKTGGRADDAALAEAKKLNECIRKYW